MPLILGNNRARQRNNPFLYLNAATKRSLMHTTMPSACNQTFIHAHNIAKRLQPNVYSCTQHCQALATKRSLTRTTTTQQTKRYRLGGKWRVADSSAGILFYENNINGTTFPPLTGWKAMKGALPAPTLSNASAATTVAAV
jgi:hypothetical protein